ncbi:hypothetical protein BDQ17DRAFT_1390688 [Cyathus striatus]|nr:hypothetical protein BDQ17DRAFT_1390688 [Cyathus striatus]
MHSFGSSSSGSSDSSDTMDTGEIIPPTHKHRTLILCFDGTGDQFDEDNSNIVNFFSMLKKDDSKQQLVYYQAGIGTYTIPQIAKPMMAKFQKALDSMVGIHLNAHVMNDAGDKICLFGFSRGAYTARALAGMYIGLLPKCNHQQVPFAYKMYSREDELGWRQSSAFKKAFSIDVDIELLAVWDTVGSVGVIPKRLPFTTFNTHVKHFRHALALDEHRVRFTPNFFNRPTPMELEHGLKWGEFHKATANKPGQRRKTMRDLEKQYSQGGEHLTDVEEVWFAGCHCDVGGGAVRNEIRNNLARISLRWMVRECFRLKIGILFHKGMFKLIGMDPDTVYPTARPEMYRGVPSLGTNRKPTEVTDFVNEEEEDLADAMSPINDMLKTSKTWWVLEYIPQSIRFQKDDDSWILKLSVNRGRGRVIPKQKSEGIKIHRTVKLRQEIDLEDEKKYVPKAKLIPNVNVTWVD